ncbi:hypothetical protein FGO68_gene13358 [Halteria grandinella]|uniref:Uncharacterized protein n=1 Tax=Halteria grandinella TaxID=5974 RepID=A0A8J8N9J3_HALGN|nr:hypothetical protein FGO68_gene13358 [Halteria grandinella]
MLCFITESQSSSIASWFLVFSLTGVETPASTSAISISASWRFCSSLSSSSKVYLSLLDQLEMSSMTSSPSFCSSPSALARSFLIYSMSSPQVSICSSSSTLSSLLTSNLGPMCLVCCTLLISCRFRVIANFFFGVVQL